MMLKEEARHNQASQSDAEKRAKARVPLRLSIDVVQEEEQT